MPDKAIDLVDEAGARAKLREAGHSEEVSEINKNIRVAVEQMETAAAQKDYEKAQFFRKQEVIARENLQLVREKFDVKSVARRVTVGKQDIDEVVSKWTGVPITSINQDEGDKLLRMEEELHHRVISQEKAISALSRAIRRSRAGLKSPNRPVGSFVFLGADRCRQDGARPCAGELPIRERLRAHPIRHVRVHGKAFRVEADRVAARIRWARGRGPAHREGEAKPVLRRVTDEIEKAHPDLFNILLQVFEDGHLTDGLGNRVNFKNTIVIMTSNIGARYIQKGTSLGFQSSDAREIHKNVTDMVLGEVKRTFNPEFVNRVDEIIVFEALSDDDMREIAKMLVAQLNDHLVERRLRITLAPRSSTG